VAAEKAREGVWCDHGQVVVFEAGLGGQNVVLGAVADEPVGWDFGGAECECGG